ncbi:MAG: endonuclease MutS2 [bacterium]|nr:endonuclease MutS2 [bacterium]MDT8395120.1 endonuclease MutS2 [bacterium]
MNTHTLTVLEYGEILTHLARYAHSEPGRQVVRRSAPHRDLEGAVRECALTAEAMDLLSDQNLELDQVQDSSGILARLKTSGVVLDPLSLLALLHNQLAVGRARTALKAAGSRCPGLSALTESMTPIPDWERWVGKSISAKGEVLDSASPELARARRQLRSARDGVSGKLEKFIRERQTAKVIQEQYVTLRNGRFVVPAKPEYHRSFEGVVQDVSQSGQTVFVEPLFAVDLNNQFAMSEARAQEEVQRALAAMSDEAARHRHAMNTNLHSLATLDHVLARARLGSRLEGVIPVFSAERTSLVQARHPLLVLDPGIRCVPVDIGIGGEVSTLAITGPNTGGKTVVLKTLGLLTLMAQSGIPVPVAAESRFRVFAKLFADIGDEQSLAQNLSTFSGHMKVIADILEEADGDTLILLDELGAGTDPQEGSALGIALLETLNDKGACTVVTTHHNQLKEFAYRAAYASNASTVFDAATLQPTFRLRMGTPGRSHALDVADRLGLETGVLKRARELMGSGAVHVDVLLGQLAGELDRESRARELAEQISGSLRDEQMRIQEERRALAAQVQEIRDKTRWEARALIRDIEGRGKKLLKGVRDTGESARPGLREAVREMEEDVMRRVPLPPPRRGGGPVAEGDQVEIVSLGARGTVTGIVNGSGEAEVLAGDIRMRVRLNDLVAITQGKRGKGEGGREKGEREKVEPVVTPASYHGSTEVPSEINLLGKTVDEALESVDRLLDLLSMDPDRSIRIVHGKGTGALKRAISDALKKDPRVSSFGPAPLNQGGAGVTVVELKG